MSKVSKRLTDVAGEDAISRLYPIVCDSLHEAVFSVDADFRILSFNTEAERITGVPRSKAVGRPCRGIFRASICDGACVLRQTLVTSRPQRDVRVDVRHVSGRRVPVLISTAVLRDAAGHTVGAVELMRDISDVESLRDQLDRRSGLSELVGTSPAMQEVYALLPDVAACDAPVLIEGPSGTGKELVARAIHDLSSRRSGPFVTVNCGALPDTLLESELFGYVKGAFTDARRDKPGRFVQAAGGTLLLDEIGELSPAFQVKLLRVLQEGEVQPLGSTRTLRPDVRVLAATNRDLGALVREGRFREDLYYRIRVVPVTLRPLRERREDIPLLVEHFVRRLAARTGKPIREVDPAALDRLVGHDYPGNVRELQNVLERAFVLCRGERIELAHLPGELLAPGAPGVARNRPSAGPEDVGTEDARALRALLDRHQWHRGEVALALGIGRNTLWRRMRRLGLLG